MTRFLPFAAALAFLPALPLIAQESAAPGPNDIVDAAPQQHWTAIEAEDLIVMTLSPDEEGDARKVIIQTMPPPFSQGWVANIRTLARAGWYDGVSINRVQDNYVVQWGDPGHDNPEGEGIEAKPLPDGLGTMSESDYLVSGDDFATFRSEVLAVAQRRDEIAKRNARTTASASAATRSGTPTIAIRRALPPLVLIQQDNYAPAATFRDGWPVGFGRDAIWPVHCYGMVGVGRSFSPDTGSGAELYTVIGHAPRHLDRNIALVGRIIDGMEHLSSLPRGSGALGFYTEDEANLRTPIVSVRVASDLPEGERPRYEYLSTESESFAKYAEARTNRRDPFFIAPAGGADVCNIPVPVRAAQDDDEQGLSQR